MAATDSGFSEYLPLVRPLDEEQARLVEILVAARGSEVSFEELRRRGIENPAVLAYELEIAGLPISHVQRVKAGGRASAVGLRLDATLPLEVPEQEWTRSRESHDREPLDTTTANSVAAGNGGAASSAAPRASRDLLPGVAIGLAAFVLVVIIVALASGTGSPGGKGPHAGAGLAGSAATHSGPAAGASAQAAPPAGARKASHRSHKAAATPPPPLSRAAQLQQSGHLLLAEGRYAAAISELRASLSAGGESAANCSEPSTPGCLAYADTLYDLGRALRLDNANAAAGAVLRERLRIDSQRAAVQHELGLNQRHRAGTSTGRHPAHAKTPHTTTRPTASPAPKHHPLTGGASAPAPGHSESGSGTPKPSAGSGSSAPGGSTAP